MGGVFDADNPPEGRTAGSFRWRIEVIWSGCVVDEYVTDSKQDAGRILGASLLDQYVVRVRWPEGDRHEYRQIDPPADPKDEQ